MGDTTSIQNIMSVFYMITRLCVDILLTSKSEPIGFMYNFYHVVISFSYNYLVLLFFFNDGLLVWHSIENLLKIQHLI